MSPEKETPLISLFENGVSIDINPKLSEVKKERAAKIRKLKQ